MDSNRSSKRELVTIDDDSSDDQPATKNKKSDAEPIPSQEVLKLQKKVIELEQVNAKLEKKFQGACRFAGEAQARVQFLENLVDTKSKPNIVDGAKSNEREAELEKKVSQLAAELEQERVDRVIERTRNDELERNLRKLDRWADEVQLIPGFSGPPKPQFPSQEFDVIPGLPVPPEPQFPSEPLDSREISAETEPEVVHDDAKKERRVEGNMDYSLNQLEEEEGNIPNETAHPTNILQFCRAGTPETISLDSAVGNTEKLIKEHGRMTVIHHVWKRMADENYEYLECKSCSMTFANSDGVIGHFLSNRHSENVRSRGGVVSLTAYQYWLRELESTPAALAATAASAAPVLHPATPISAETEPEVVYDGAKKTKKCVDEPEQSMNDLLNQLEDEGGNIPNETAHPTNLLQFCRAGTPETFSFDNALGSIEKLIKEHGRKAVYKYFGNRVKDNKETMKCEVCKSTKNIPIRCMINHLMWKHHITKARSRGSAISLAAYQYWFGQLESTPAAPAASATQTPNSYPLAAGPATNQSAYSTPATDFTFPATPSPGSSPNYLMDTPVPSVIEEDVK